MVLTPYERNVRAIAFAGDLYESGWLQKTTLRGRHIEYQHCDGRYFALPIDALPPKGAGPVVAEALQANEYPPGSMLLVRIDATTTPATVIVEGALDADT